VGAYGLQTHIWSNNTKSVLLLAGFPVLLIFLMYGLFLLFAGLALDPGAGGLAANPFLWAGVQLSAAWPYALVGAGLWFAVAYAFYQSMIDAATGARPTDAPQLYNLLENLCISRGIPMPSLRVMDTDALNAFASGLHKGQYAITVTRGLTQRLEPDELEAVLAHELTHIRNHDVRLLVIAVIFVGIFSFIGEMFFRGLRSFDGGGIRIRTSGSSSNDSGGAAGAKILAVVVALVIIAVSYALAVVVRFALSRRREYLADAGAVELTKNPDALIRALRKISDDPVVERAPSEVREMFIENPHAEFGGLFATHPPIERRIAALVTYAAGRDAPAPVRPRVSPWRRRQVGSGSDGAGT
jgi:heat shock protein HtpX